MIQTRFRQLPHVSGVRQLASIGIEAADHAELFGVRHQFGQVGAQGGFAAGEDHVRDTDLPNLVQHPEPLFLAVFIFGSGSFVIAMQAAVIAAVGQRQVHAVGRGGLLRERLQDFQIQITDRAGVFNRRDDRQEGLLEFRQIGGRLSGIHRKNACNPFDRGSVISSFEEQVGH